MIEAIAILAIGAAILLYAERQSNKKTIEKQSYKIRHLTGNLNEDDKKENQQLLDDYHFEKIVRKVRQKSVLQKKLKRNTNKAENIKKYRYLQKA